MNLAQIFAFLEGKKTYVTAIVTFALALAQASGYTVPEYVYAMLGAVGIATVRHSISTSAVAIVEATTPDPVVTSTK